MKLLPLLLAACLLQQTAISQLNRVPGRRGIDSVKQKPSLLRTTPRTQQGTTAAEAVSTGVILPTAVFPQPVMQQLAPAPLVITPQMKAAHQWWMRVNPTDYTVYQSPFKLVPHGTGETRAEQFIAKKSMSFVGWQMDPAQRASWSGDSMVHLLALQDLVQVHMPSLDDKTLFYLSQLPNLRAVYYHNSLGNCDYAYGNPLTDNGLQLLLQNRNLEYVGLQATGRITNSGFAHFRGMDRLKVLYTHCWTGITDEALLSLEGCSSLEALYFIGSNISDQGLNNLLTLKDKLPYLTKIYVHGSRTTRDGEAAFRAAWGRPIEVLYQ